ncbi:MAG: hypothetical protein KF914_10830 [Rhizobiaceae bacterium]|nr:hypothetical protein [Rhizobiaceae bacterium]
MGRSKRSPVAQGWDKIDATYVGIDVSKHRLDVHVRPGDEVFFVRHDGDGVAALAERLAPLKPAAIAVEATGGFELIAADGIAKSSGALSRDMSSMALSYGHMKSPAASGAHGAIWSLGIPCREQMTGFPNSDATRVLADGPTRSL